MQRVRRSRDVRERQGRNLATRKRGQSLSEIGRALDRIPGAVFHVVAARGGVPPAPRCRSQLVLTVAEREEISRGLAAGESFRDIGAVLGRAASTISREVGRHGGRGRYRASIARAVETQLLMMPDNREWCP